MGREASRVGVSFTCIGHTTVQKHALHSGFFAFPVMSFLTPFGVSIAIMECP